jgi:hypothetical protein
MANYKQDGYSLISVYRQFVTREKVVYKALNQFKHCGNLSIGLAWSPSYRSAEFVKHV